MEPHPLYPPPRWRGGGLLRRGPDLSEHPLNVVHHLDIVEPEDTLPEALQELLTKSIILAAALVDRAVYLDHQLRARAVEVDDEAVDGMLTPELEPFELVVPERLPQSVLGFGRRVSGLPR
jgi:hypothetical protein